MNEHEIIIGILKHLRENPPESGEHRIKINDYLISVNQSDLAIKTAINKINDKRFAVILIGGLLAGKIAGVSQTVHNISIEGSINMEGVDYLLSLERNDLYKSPIEVIVKENHSKASESSLKKLLSSSSSIAGIIRIGEFIYKWVKAFL